MLDMFSPLALIPPTLSGVREHGLGALHAVAVPAMQGSAVAMQGLSLTHIWRFRPLSWFSPLSFVQFSRRVTPRHVWHGRFCYPDWVKVLPGGWWMQGKLVWQYRSYDFSSWDTKQVLGKRTWGYLHHPASLSDVSAKSHQTTLLAGGREKVLILNEVVTSASGISSRWSPPAAGEYVQPILIGVMTILLLRVDTRECASHS